MMEILRAKTERASETQSFQSWRADIERLVDLGYTSKAFNEQPDYMQYMSQKESQIQEMS